MSFFDKTETVGWMIIVIGILGVVRALLSVVGVVNGDYASNEKIGLIVTAVGFFVGAGILLVFGNKVRVGAISSKIDVLAGYVQTMGLVTMISGIFLIIAGAIVGSDAGTIMVSSGVVCLIFGAVVLYLGKTINNGKSKTGILWMILVIVFFLLMVGSLFTIGGDAVQIIQAVCSFIMYLFIFVFLFDREVKNAMV